MPKSLADLAGVTGSFAEPLERRVMLSGNPAWLAAGSAATWNSSSDTLTVTGSATIIADPGSDEPNILASGSSAQLTMAPATSPTDVHIGGITLTDGASITMASVGASRSNTYHNVLVLGTLGAVNDPTLSIDSNSKLDLMDNDMLVHTGSSDAGNDMPDEQMGVVLTNELHSVAALAADGRNVAPGGVYDGTWAGKGLTSSSAASIDSNAGYEEMILAVVQNSDMYLGGYSAWTVGSASETLGAKDIIVKYTYNGDLNLAGAVDGNAGTIFSTFYDGGATSGDTYAEGDLNGDGKIDGNDATIFATMQGLGMPPTGLAATSTDNGSVSLSWDTANGASGYDILREGPGDGSYHVVGTSGTNTFTDTSVAADTTYTYEVVAIEPAGDTSPSNPSNPVTTVPATLPTPLGLAVQAVTGDSVTLSWKTSTDPDVVGYDVYHSNGQLVGQNVSTNQFTDTGLTPGQTYDYWITAVNSAGVQSPPSPTVEALTSVNTGLLANAGAPQQVSVSQSVMLDGSFNDSALNALPMVFNWSLVDESNGDVVATGSGQALNFTAGQWQPASQGQNPDPNQTGTFLATFTVADALGNSATANTAIYVGSAPTLSIQGSTQVQTGTVVNLEVVPSAPNLIDATSYVWTVSRANQIVASGSGSQLAFQPATDGSYSVAVQGIYQDASISASCIVTASAAAPQNVQIVGPSQGSVGRALVFSSGAQLPANSGEELTYSWSVTRNGEPFAIPTTTPDTLQTFSFVPPSLSALPSTTDPNPYDTYVVTLNIRADNESPILLQKTVYVGWSQPALGTWDSVFSEVPSSENDGNSPPIDDIFAVGDAIVIQPNGDIIVAGAAHDQDDSRSVRDIFLARFSFDNGSLNLDLTFGDQGFVYTNLKLYDYPQNTQNYQYQLRPGLALLPNGDIAVGGTDFGLGVPGVAAIDCYTSNGQLDTLFGGSGNEILPDGTPAVTIPAGEAIAPFDSIGPTGDESAGFLALTYDSTTSTLLAGGSAAIYEDNPPDGIDPYDFAIARFNIYDDGLNSNPSGTLDTAFGVNGMVLEQMSAADAITENETVTQLLVLPNDSFIAGGDAWTQGGFNDDYAEGTNAFALAEFDPLGSLVTNQNSDGDGFGANGNGTVLTQYIGANGPAYGDYTVLSSLLLQPEGASYNIVATGVTNSGASGVIAVCYTSAGQLSEQFGDYIPDTNQRSGIVFTAVPATTSSFVFYGGGALTSDGGILIGAGTGEWDTSPTQSMLFMYTPNGVLDPTFGTDGHYFLNIPDGLSTDPTPDSDASAVDVLPNGTIYVAGAVLPNVGYNLPGNTDTSSGVYLARFTPGYGDASNLNATAVPSGVVNLQWTDSGSDEDGFLILRSTSAPADPGNPDDSAFEVIATVGAGVTTYVDTDTQPGTHYWYRIAAFTGDTKQGESNVSDAVTGDPNVSYQYVGTIYVPVDGSVATSSISLKAGVNYELVASGYFNLSENYPEPESDFMLADAEYKWYPGPITNSDWAADTHFGIEILGPGVGSTTPSPNLDVYWGAPSTDHTYQILWTGDGAPLSLEYYDDYYPDNAPFGIDPDEAYNAETNPADPTKLLRVDIYAPIPVAPTGLVATPDRQDDQITLTWSNNDPSAEAFQIQQSVGGGAFNTVAVEPASVSSWTDSGVEANTRYTYRVLTVDPSGQSAYSNEASALIADAAPTIPIVPQSTSALDGYKFSYAIGATDADEPASDLTYLPPSSPDVADLSMVDGVVSGILVPDPTKPLPQEFFVTLGVEDQYGAVTYAILPVIATAGPPPQVSIAPTAQQTSPTQIQLSVLGADSAGEANLTYTWSIASVSNGTEDGATSTFSQNGNNGAKNTTATLSESGNYTFSVTITNANGAATEAFTAPISIAQQLTTVEVSPDTQILAPGMTQSFVIFGYDQFGNDMDIASSSWSVSENGANPPTPPGTTSLTNSDGTTLISVDPSTGVVRVGPADGSYTVTDTATDAQGDAASGSAAISVLYTGLIPPFSASAQAIGSLGVSLNALWQDGSDQPNINYTWSLVSGPPNESVTFPSSNGTADAKLLDLTVPAAGTYTFEVVADPGGNNTYSAETTVTVVGVATNWIEVAPQVQTVLQGQSVSFSASEFSPTGSTLNTSLTWSVAQNSDPNNPTWAGGTIQFSGNGSTATYTAPATIANWEQGLPVATDQITVTAADGTTYTFDVDVDVQNTNPPVYPPLLVQITSVGDGQSDNTVPTIGIPGLTDEGGTSSSSGGEAGNGPQAITSDANVLGYVSGGAGELNWTLTATPLNVSNPQAITLASGTGAMSGSSPLDPPIATSIGTVRPEMLANGLYTLTLTATSADGATGSDSVTVSVDSDLKLGNLNLPFTDLSIPTSSGTPLTLTRVYDSTQSTQNSGDFGPGWQLEQTDGDLTTTVQSDPADAAGLPMGFADGDMVYVTLPGGEQHAFEFVAKLVSDDPGNPLNGLLQGIDTYSPQFVAVDGSSATLTVSQTITDPSGSTGANGDEIALQQNGDIYIDSDTGEQYNPANPLFGGTYTLTEPDGTTYTINASSGEITSSTDANGNVTSYGNGGMSSGSEGITLSRDPNSGQITSAVNQNDPSQRVDYAYAADVKGAELIGMVDPSGNQTTYVYANQMSVAYAGNADTQIYAQITLENPPPGTLPSSYTISLTPVEIQREISGEATTDYWWYTAAVPTAIPAGTELKIEYKLQSGDSPEASDAVLQSMSWTYQGAASDGMLVGIIGPTGIVSLSADYDASGELTSLTNSLGKSAGVSTGAFQGDSASQGVTDLDGNSTQNIYDSNGNIIRTIQEETDANGNLTGYLVTVHTYNYAEDDDAGEDLVEYGMTDDGKLASEEDWQPFFISGSDPQGLRYTQEPTQPAQETFYKMWDPSDPNDMTDLFLPASQETFAADGSAQITSFSDYVDGKPSVITNDQGTTTNVYDTTRNAEGIPSGNLLSTTNPVGDTTTYTYTNGNDPLVPAGLLLTTSTNGQQVSSNLYYGSSYGTVATPADAPWEAGMLASSTDASGITQSYSYDAEGNKISDITLWKDPNNVVWNNETDYVYNASGQLISTTTNYVWRLDDSGSVVYYSPAAGIEYTGTTTTTHYNALGQQDYTSDEYGQRTYYVYDSNGNLVDTIYPNGTESRSVYDAMGNVIWSSGTYASGTTVNQTTGAITFDNTTVSPTATETVYNALGQAVETLSYANVVIAITADATGGTYEAASPVIGPTEQAYATTSTTYNAQGQVASQTDAGGLTTDTSYYANGQVESVGPVTTSGTPTTNTFYDPDGQVWTMDLSGSVNAGDTFTVTITGSDGTTQDVLTYSAPSSETAANAAAGIAAAINAACTDPAADQALFRGMTAVVLANPDGDTDIRLAADPSHQPVTVAVSKSSSAGFSITADASQAVRVVEVMPSGWADLSSTFTIEFSDPTTGEVNTLSVTPTDPQGGQVTPADFSAAMAAAINQAANDPADYPMLGDVSAEDMGGYVRVLVGGSSGSALPLVTTLPGQYDVVDLYAFGLSTTVTQDADGNWSATQSDPLGRTVWSVAPDGGVTQTLYSVGGEPIVGHADQGVPGGGYEQVAIDPLGNATDSYYNAAGQLTNVYQPQIEVNGSSQIPQWQYQYDVNGNLRATITPNDDATTSTYDPLGDEISRTVGSNTETWVYDQYGRLYQSTDFDGNTQTDTYYASGADTGMLQTVVYAGPGQTTETVNYTYTALGQKASVTDSSDGVTTYTYDPITGNVASVTSPQGTVNYVYDPATGRLIETWTGTTHADATTDTLYGYNVEGELASETVVKQDGAAPAAPTVQYAGFDAKGDAEPSIGLPVTLFEYDADGNLIKQLNPNGTETDTTIDLLDDQETVTNKMTSTGQILSSYFYQSDLDGRKTSDTETRLNNDGVTYTTTNIGYEYDALSHLTQETYSDGITADAYSDVYTYDSDGNRLSETQTTSAGTQVTDYNYNFQDQLTYQYTFNPSTYAQTSSTSYTYDANGSMISATTYDGNGNVTGTDTYTYDARNRMISATVNGVTETITYDDDGDRVAQSASGTTTTYLVDENNPSGYTQVLEERTGSSLITYVTGPQGVMSQNINGTVAYFVTDGHGSTRLLTNASGHVVGEYDYDAFGNVLTLSSAAKPWTNAITTPYQFAGMRLDAITGMDLTESRPYMPTVGRFPMADSYIGGPGDLNNANLYVYVANDPLNAGDPSGRDFTLIDVLTAFSIGIAIDLGAYAFANTLASFLMPPVAAPATAGGGLMTPPSWAIPTSAPPGLAPGLSGLRDPNCQLTALNRSPTSPASAYSSLPYDAMESLANTGQLRSIMDGDFANGRLGVLGYPLAPGGTVPAGWHGVALYVIANTPNTTLLTGQEYDFHWRYQMSNGRWTSTAEVGSTPSGDDWGGFHFLIGQATYVGMWAINTPPPK